MERRLRVVRPPAEASNLPAEPGRLVGRNGELAALRRLLASERLVTLLGPPGIGKSRLALRLAHELGGAAYTGDEPRLSGIRLLLLDGAERIDRGRIEGWIADWPKLRILATSTVRLGLGCEACLELAPPVLEEAVELYEERAQRLSSDHADRNVVVQLVERLDRLPLAIELAAARARVLRPRQLLSRLDDGLDVLRAPMTDAIRAGWERLEPVEKRALSQASVFAGGFTLEAAEAVLDVEAPLDVLEAIRDKSFLQLDASEPPRFRMLETIRAFASRELDDPDEVRLRHARFFAREQRRPPGSTGPVAERENLLAAWRGVRGVAPELSARLALVLVPILSLQGPPELEAEVVADGVAAARAAAETGMLARLLRSQAMVSIRAGRLDEARRQLEESRVLARGAGDPVMELYASIEVGRLLFAEGRFDEADLVLSGEIACARDLGEPFFEGYAWNFRGMVAEAQGRFNASGSAFATALDLFRRVGSRRYEALALMNLGVVCGARGRLADATTHFEQAIAAFRDTFDRAGEADAVLNLGAVHLTGGRLDDAEPFLRRALALERGLGNRRAEAFALGNLGIAAHERGELRSARELLQACLETCRACGERHVRGLFLPFAAAVQAALGNLPEATADFAEARAYLEELGDPGQLRTMEVLEIFLGLARGDAALDEARALLAAPTDDLRSSELAMALRLVSRAIAHRAGDVAAAAETPLPALEVGPDAAFFRLPGSAPVDLRRRRAQRLLLRSLVDQRLAAPGVGLSVERLFEGGWPGERALPTAAAARVYVAIRTLRSLGLGALLHRQDDGYLLDPAHPVRRVPEI